METATSADGTVIAYERVGEGPPLVVSVGAFCTRRTFVAPDDLTRRFTVVTYDRRGRGDSGNTEPFAPEREYEDLAAVAAASGPEPPFVYGHSSGGAIALRAAAAGVPTAGIVAYEAPFQNDDTPRPSVNVDQHVRALVGAGRRREAVIFWIAEVARLPREMVAHMEDAPWVSDLEPMTDTLSHDLGVTAGGVPTSELGRITAPVLIVGGENSPAWFHRSVADQAAAIPGAQLMLLDGCDHSVPAELISSILVDFFGRHGTPMDAG